MATYAVGSLVEARGREWVVLPGSDDRVLRIRPLGGVDSDATSLSLALEGGQVRTATFEKPSPEQAGDVASARLLRDAVRLSFRAGAGPFRSLGRIAVEPRPYQLVPLLMALKLEPIRLLIADDVGIGKTIEAALVARELLDRGEIDRMAVICPPHLCDQWQRELADKFHIDAVVVRPGTVTGLERGLPVGVSLFDRNPVVIVSIDYIKSDKRRADFLRACPDFVIVDEAHACAEGGSGGVAQQQRHQLLKDLAKNADRHQILCTATPHSGIEAAFRSLLALLDPAFMNLPEDEVVAANEALRLKLAEHFVQRRRADIVDFLNERTVFPERVTAETSYQLSPEYARFFEKVRAYATELLRASSGENRFRQRVTWWAVLAMLRCVTSSPAAAAATLRTRAGGLEEDGAGMRLADLDALGERSVFDLDTSDAAEEDDVVPGADTVADGGADSAERRRLRELASEADALAGTKDRKLVVAADTIRKLVEDGFSPVVFCRYIATAEYVAEELRSRLKGLGVEIEAVTGRLPSEERARRVDELGEKPKRILVATDCLSEGINLQRHFDAVLHYDLSWNPTRHEQREGRVDRFGQPSPQVRTILHYGEDNRVDGAVMRVLLRKAEAIRKALGVSVPVPSDSEKVLEAVFEALFLSDSDPRQLTLDFGESERLLDAQRRQKEFEIEWESIVERAKRSRTIFAQRSIHHDELKHEIAEAAEVLGDSGAVARFVRDSCAKLNAPLLDDGAWPLFTPGTLPPQVTDRIDLAKPVRIGFDLPVPDGVAHVARTSPLVEALGSYLVDTALDPLLEGPAARCGAIRTRAVERRTTVLLLRVRMHLDVTRDGKTDALLAEEAVVAAYAGRGDGAEWLDQAAAEALLDAEPDSNVPAGQRRQWIEDALADLPAQDEAIAELAQERADAVRDAHVRVRKAANLKGVSYQVRPTLPVDVLGIYVLMPAAGAVA